MVQEFEAGHFLGKWSSDAQLLWIDGAIGDSLSISLSNSPTGRFRLLASVTTSPDFGIHTVEVEGQAGATLDFYSGQTLPAGVIELGVFDLNGGDTEVRFTAIGSNTKAIPRRGFGIDYLMLVAADPLLPGDYNDDGTVDAADYTAWRDAVGTSVTLPNDDTPGTGPDDFTRWSSNYASGMPTPTSSQWAIPEPAACIMVSAALSLLGAVLQSR